MQRPESCPHCLNRGGSLAACGIVEDRNYDKPTDSSGNVMSELPVQVRWLVRVFGRRCLPIGTCFCGALACRACACQLPRLPITWT